MIPQRNLLRKFAIFSVIGVMNTGVDISIFVLLVKLGAPALPANALSWFCAVCFSYAANSRFTFRRDPRISRRKSMLRFMTGSAMIALLFSSVSIAGIGDWIGVVPAKIAGTLVAVLVSFIVAGWSIEGLSRKDGTDPGRTD
ncbi:MAG: GtrA family protein [Zhengella sp.]|uniref:GtrA family protein n=1 Tax=Zhengella sp. TaxID=2282762 RepID=UPI001D88EE0F|nr:GtrA family protein [Notoacmeibacter sp.]MCC0027375.1 GtrA family protein [Brucellaceae bacterium]